MESLIDKSVRIPIRINQGQLDFIGDGSLLMLKDGTVGELVVPASAVRDENLLASLNREESVLFLSATTQLLFNINLNEVPETLRKFVKHPRIHPLPGGYVEGILQADLYLQIRGTKNPTLKGCRCFIPALEETARSVNHAYSLISMAFEPHRMSHTANVFKKVLYEDEKSGLWQKLDILREQFLAKLSISQALGN